MSETTYSLELTDKQMASISVLSTGYLALLMANGGCDLITGEKFELDIVLSASEVIDIFNLTLGNPRGSLPDLIEKLREILVKGKK